MVAEPCLGFKLPVITETDAGADKLVVPHPRCLAGETRRGTDALRRRAKYPHHTISPDETGSSLGRISSLSVFYWENSARVSNFCHHEPTLSKNWSGQLSIRFGGLSIPIFGSAVLFYVAWPLKLSMMFIHGQGQLTNTMLGSKAQKSKAINQQIYEKEINSNHGGRGVPRAEFGRVCATH